MSMASIVVLAVIVAGFVLFGAALAWADHQTRHLNQRNNARARARVYSLRQQRRTGSGASDPKVAQIDRR